MIVNKYNFVFIEDWTRAVAITAMNSMTNACVMWDEDTGHWIWEQTHRII